MFNGPNAPVAERDASLKRELGLFELTATGVGIISIAVSIISDGIAPRYHQNVGSMIPIPAKPYQLL